MKDSEFKERFFRSDSLGHMTPPVPKKRKSISLRIILIAIVLGGLPVYTYLVVTEKMFELDFVKKFFNSSEPTAAYQPETNFHPDESGLNNQPPPINYRKVQRRTIPSNKKGEFIYSWVDENGIKQFSNVKPTGHKNDLNVTKAYNSTPSQKLNRRESLSSVRNVKESRVYVQGNQVLVPVKFGNNGKEVSTRLLLDTGAGITSIHDDLAYKFRGLDYRSSKSTIADGSVVKTKRTNFDYIIVGPYRINNFTATEFNYRKRLGILKYNLELTYERRMQSMVNWFFGATSQSDPTGWPGPFSLSNHRAGIPKS
nr:retropepsin-like aspartic protease [uncultured Desulfobacter sp.]